MGGWGGWGGSFLALSAGLQLIKPKWAEGEVAELPLAGGFIYSEVRFRVLEPAVNTELILSYAPPTPPTPIAQRSVSLLVHPSLPNQENSCDPSVLLSASLPQYKFAPTC